MSKKILELFAGKERSAQEPQPQAQPEPLSAPESAPAEESAPAQDWQEKMKQDVSQLLSLFPKLKAEAIPQQVWDRVQQGDSLSAAYCLWLVSRVKEQVHIKAVNDKVNHLAPPRLADSGQQSHFFTRDAVKNMSSQQIRDNLNEILQSMDSWK